MNNTYSLQFLLSQMFSVQGSKNINNQGKLLTIEVELLTLCSFNECRGRC